MISALVQDAVLPVSEIRFSKSRRSLALLVNRLRREDARVRQGIAERVQSVLMIDNVLSVASQGVSRQDPDLVVSILSLAFEPGEDAEGHLLVTLAGDGVIRASVEALEVRLRDVTRPYEAPSKALPDHGA